MMRLRDARATLIADLMSYFFDRLMAKLGLRQDSVSKIGFLRLT